MQFIVSGRYLQRGLIHIAMFVHFDHQRMVACLRCYGFGIGKWRIKRNGISIYRAAAWYVHVLSAKETAGNQG